jgi:hypothetical protein
MATDEYFQDLANSAASTTKAFSKGSFSAILILAVPIIELSFVAWVTVQLIKLPQKMMRRKVE